MISTIAPILLALLIILLFWAWLTPLMNVEDFDRRESDTNPNQNH